jgi:hypothetical protein
MIFFTVGSIGLIFYLKKGDWWGKKSPPAAAPIQSSLTAAGSAAPATPKSVV